MFPTQHTIKHTLQNFYNQHATQFSQTRKKHRPEFDHIVSAINSLADKKTIRILELGCGDGRLYRYLQEKIQTPLLRYTGVDFSQELINIAENNCKKLSTHKHTAKRICDDMQSYISSTKQESFDYVIAVASFQHISRYKDRLYIMKNIYKSLNYEGSVIMINRALSHRAIKKYRRSIIRAIIHCCISLGKRKYNDLYIPRKHKHGVEYRYYHFFSLAELKKLCLYSGFIVQQCCYLLPNHQPTYTAKKAQNSLLIATKSVYTD